jgi:predicted dehydrogenase
MAHRIGILGLGSMGERMVRNMRQHAGFAVVAACDPDPGAAAKLVRLAPQARLVADAAELVADPAVDCLYIATPPARHLAHAHPAFDRGKAVFCEKPLATDLALAQAAVDRAARERRVAAVNFPFASAPAVRALASGLRSGELGGIERVDIEVAFVRWPRPQQATAHWLGRREEGGFVREVLSRFVFLT